MDLRQLRLPLSCSAGLVVDFAATHISVSRALKGGKTLSMLCQIPQQLRGKQVKGWRWSKRAVCPLVDFFGAGQKPSDTHGGSTPNH